MATFYILLRPDLTPIVHVAAATLPFERNGTTPRFLTFPKGNKSWYKEAVLDRPPLGPGEQYGAVVYENIDQPVATIRFPIEAVPPPPIPDALQDIPPSVATVAGLRAEQNKLRQHLRGE